MPFLALAYGRRVRTGTPVSKLVWLHLVAEAHQDGYAEIDINDLVGFTHSSRRQVLDALQVLKGLGLIYWPEVQFRHPDDWCCCIVKLPVAAAVQATAGPTLLVPEVRETDGDRCPWCSRGPVEEGEEDDPANYFRGALQAVLIIPAAYGGLQIAENIQHLCPDCANAAGSLPGRGTVHE